MVADPLTFCCHCNVNLELSINVCLKYLYIRYGLSESCMNYLDASLLKVVICDKYKNLNKITKI